MTRLAHSLVSSIKPIIKDAIPISRHASWMPYAPPTQRLWDLLRLLPLTPNRSPHRRIRMIVRLCDRVRPIPLNPAAWPGVSPEMSMADILASLRMLAKGPATKIILLLLTGFIHGLQERLSAH